MISRKSFNEADCEAFITIRYCPGQKDFEVDTKPKERNVTRDQEILSINAGAWISLAVSEANTPGVHRSQPANTNTLLIGPQSLERQHGKLGMSPQSTKPTAVLSSSAPCPLFIA